MLQKNDPHAQAIRGWRAAETDTLGPVIATGIDNARLLLGFHLNGETTQKESTVRLIDRRPRFGIFICQFITLYLGVATMTGTTDKSSRIESGDLVERKFEGVSGLRHRAVVAKSSRITREIHREYGDIDRRFAKGRRACVG
jgi:2-keto-4-pentenoate hydratase/2-oxohepta-3-ene-1,7-dioic acid hydratase in catechol pathway